MSSSTPQFSPIDLIKASWGPTTANAGPLIGGVVLAMIISMAVSMMSMGLGAIIVQGPMTFGLYTVALAASRGKVADFQDVFSGFQNFGPAFAAGLLTSIFPVIPMILCLIPYTLFSILLPFYDDGLFFLCVFPGLLVGLLVFLLYVLVYLYMIEEKLECWPAMERSRIVVMDNFAQWGLLFLVIVVMNVIAAIFTCGLGLLITFPITMVTIAKAFDIQNGGGRMVPPALDAEFGA